jgi:hypothetical protein
MVEKLWLLLSARPVEQEEFFKFLKGPQRKFNPSADRIDNDKDPIFDQNDVVQIFESFLCSTTIDWACLGDGAFECFHEYFSLADTHTLSNGDSDNNSSTVSTHRKLGLDTLWRVALDIPTPITSNKAVELLLHAYDLKGDEEGGEETYATMFSIIFAHLKAYMKADEGKEEAFSRMSLRARRCLQILTTFISNSKNRGADPIHAVHSSIPQFDLTIQYRRITSYYNQTTQLDVKRVEKGSEGSVTLRVHPCHTFAQLRTMFCIALDIPAPQAQVNVDGRIAAQVHDGARLHELALPITKELSVSYRVSYNSNSRGSHISYI